MAGKVLRALFSWFRRADGGVAAIEFAIIAPTLSFVLLSTVSLFLMLRGQETVEMATFTIADIVSRQTTAGKTSLDVDYALFLKMLPGNAGAVQFRVSSLNKAPGGFSVGWSYAVAPMVKLTTAAIPASILPEVADGDSVILVETKVGYAPLYSTIGLSSGTYENVATNRPRFTAAIVADGTF